MDGEYLFHGSNYYFLDCIMPHISFDYEPYVYATDDFDYAVVRAGKFNIEDFAIKEEYLDAGHKFTLVELRRGAFVDVFSTEGYVYLVDKHSFAKKDNEYIAKHSVEIKEVIHIGNVLLYMLERNDKYNLIYFKDRDMYFNSIGVNLEEYLARRQSRVNKILKLQNTP